MILAPARALPGVRALPQIADLSVGVGVAVAIVVAMAAGLSTAVLIAVVVSLGIAIARPTAGLATLTVLVPLREPDVLHPPGPIILLIASIAAGCLLRLPIDRNRTSPGAGAWLLVAYLLMCAVAVPVALSGGLAAEQETIAYRFFQTLGLAIIFVLARYLLAETSIEPYLLVLLGSAVFAAALGILQGWWGGPAGIPLRSILSPAPDAEWLDRVSGPFSNTNYFGFFLSSALVLVTAVASRVKARARLLLIGIGIICAFALVLTFSRGAVVALASGLLVLAWLRSRRLAITLGAVFVLVAALAYPVFLGARLDRSFGGDVQSAQLAEDENLASREGILTVGLRIFQSQPIFGVGFGRFQFESPEFEDSSAVTFPHNTYVQILAEQGVLGGAMAVAIVLAIALAIRRATAGTRRIAAAALVTMLAGGMFVEVTVSIQAAGLAVFAIGAALAASAMERRQAPARSAADRARTIAPPLVHNAHFLRLPGGG